MCRLRCLKGHSKYLSLYNAFYFSIVQWRTDSDKDPYPLPHPNSILGQVEEFPDSDDQISNPDDDDEYDSDNDYSTPRDPATEENPK